MKKYTKEELMISERKEAEKQRPQPGELTQGILFPIFKAKECFNSAIHLFENNQPSVAVNLFLHGVEELSKSVHFFQLLLSWDNPEKINQYKKDQKDHNKKLESVFLLLNMIEVMNSLSLSEKPESEISNYEQVEMVLFWEEGRLDWGINPNKEYSKTQKIFHKQQTLLSKDLLPNDQKDVDVNNLIKTWKTKLSTKYHKLRLSTSYINFKDKTVSSPYHCLQEVNIESYKSSALMLKKLLNLLMQKAECYLPIYLKPIEECYYSSDKNKIRTLKREINRRVKRTLPAVRLCTDYLYKRHTGKGIDECFEKEMKGIQKIQIKDWPAIIKKVGNLIVSNEKIEEIYYYPPLKEKAKIYYSQFSSHKPK